MEITSLSIKNLRFHCLLQAKAMLLRRLVFRDVWHYQSRDLVNFLDILDPYFIASVSSMKAYKYQGLRPKWVCGLRVCELIWHYNRNIITEK